MDESSLTRLAAGGEMDTTEQKATLERGLDGWQEQARKTCMKFKGRTKSSTWDEITKELSMAGEKGGTWGPWQTTG